MRGVYFVFCSLPEFFVLFWDVKDKDVFIGCCCTSHHFCSDVVRDLRLFVLPLVHRLSQFLWVLMVCLLGDCLRSR